MQNPSSTMGGGEQQQTSGSPNASAPNNKDITTGGEEI
jgi:hypothetical protein